MPPYPEDVYTHDVKLLARFIFREMGERWPGQGLDIIFAEHPEVDCARFMVDFCDQWRALSRNSGPSLSFTVARPDEQPGLQIADMIAFLFAEKVRVRNGETPFFPDLIKEGVVQIFEELPPDR